MHRFKLFLLTLLIPASSLLAVWTPEKPVPPRLVVDNAGMLSRNEVGTLEQHLVQFSNSTSTQIVIVTVNDLHGEDIDMVAAETGHKWGVGQDKFDNGLVMLIRNKTSDSKGEVAIATGYGLEGVIPDAIAKRIIENEILPRFKQGDIYGGIVSGVNVLEQLSLGEFSASEYKEKTARNDNSPLGWIVPLIIFFFIFGGGFGRARRTQRSSIGRNLPFWVLLGMMGSGSRHSGSFGNFSSGRGGFSGGGGGFGGFGGGGFGGGGASGSW